MKPHLLLIVIVSIANIGNGEETYLHKVTENIASVVRIINAIGLTNLMADKKENVSSRLAIAELLDVELDQFLEVLAIDSSEMSRTLESIGEKVKNIDSNQLTSLASLAEAEKSIQAVNLAINMSQNFSLGRNFQEDGLIEAIINITESNDDLIVGFCTNNMLNDVSALIEMVSEERGDPLKLLKLKGHISMVKMCLDNMHTLMNTLDAKGQRIWDENGRYLSQMHSRGLIEQMLEDNATWTLIIPKHIKSLKANKQAVQGIAGAVQTSHGSLAEQLVNANILHHTAVKQLREGVYTQYAGGFEGARDMTKVVDDANGEFFKRVLARGSNRTKEFSELLKPFSQMGETIVKLEDKWLGFRDIDRNLGGLMNISSSFKVAEKLLDGFDPAHFDDLIKSTEEVFKKCWTDIEPEATFPKMLEDYNDQYRDFEIFIFEFSKYRSFLSLFESRLKGQNFTGAEMLKKCFEGAEKKIPDKIDDENIFKVVDSLDDLFLHNCGEKDEVDTVTLLQKFLNFTETQTTLLDAAMRIRAGINSTRYTFAEMLKKSRAPEVFECFEKLHFKPLKILDIVNFVKSLHNFPPVDLIDKAKSFMDAISEIKIAFNASENAIQMMHQKTISRRPKRNSNISITLEKLRHFNSSLKMSDNLGYSVQALRELQKVEKNREALLEVPDFPQKVSQLMTAQNKLAEFKSPRKKIEVLLELSGAIEALAKTVVNKNLSDMVIIMETLAKGEGIEGNRTELGEFKKHLLEHGKNQSDLIDIAEKMEPLTTLDLNFAKYRPILTTARIHVRILQEFFDDLFGNKPRDEKAGKRKQEIITDDSHILWYTILPICTFLSIIIGAFIVYGFTKTGKETYQDWWYYFRQDMVEFEKRWRYSKFLDTSDAKNTLLDAIREMNIHNVKAALKKGAYVNVYNRFGNSALHMATKLGEYKIAEVLIKFGADQTLLNAKNQTPEEAIPAENAKNLEPDVVENIPNLKAMYKKYRGRTFRKTVPRRFPTSQFHIYFAHNTDDTLTNNFMKAFPGITSDEDLPTTTHVVVKLNSEGIMETDEFPLLVWILNGHIIVKEKWMEDCLTDPKYLTMDYLYLVDKVKYRGVVYDTVIQWSQAWAKLTMPFLCGAWVAVIINDFPHIESLNNLITVHGGVVLTEFPNKAHFNETAHPYLHSNLGSIFVIHNNQTDLTEYKKDPMFAIFTDEEFVHFMLKREFHKDPRKNPPPALKSEN